MSGRGARARAARLIQPARRAPLNAGIKSFPTRDRRPSETEIQNVQKSPNMHASKMGAAWAASPRVCLGGSLWLAGSGGAACVLPQDWHCHKWPWSRAAVDWQRGEPVRRKQA
eukprot:COSAG01_NODE_47851_length_386_cov_1.055749_1_plen_112_part_01